jgi:CubicO group peptidase (beta-lactamase class C family)
VASDRCDRVARRIGGRSIRAISQGGLWARIREASFRTGLTTRYSIVAIDVGGGVLLALCLVAGGARSGSGQVLDSARVEAFFDHAWAETLSDGGAVPGAVITVVQDRTVVLNKGYGVTDIATGAAVDPSRTRVRIGSVSKLFAALTALALVDEGRLHLDRDVNDYLRDVRVPYSSDPVTVRALLSRRARLDTGLWGYTSRSRSDVAMSHDAYQRRLLPGRAPDRLYGYDNLGVGLLGYLTGQVHGRSFARAVEAKVIRPLRLEQTTIGVPDWQAEHLAACHYPFGDLELLPPAAKQQVPGPSASSIGNALHTQRIATYSDRSACKTSIRDARVAGISDATIAALMSTAAAPITGSAPGSSTVPNSPCAASTST